MNVHQGRNYFPHNDSSCKHYLDRSLAKETSLANTANYKIGLTTEKSHFDKYLRRSLRRIFRMQSISTLEKVDDVLTNIHFTRFFFAFIGVYRKFSHSRANFMLLNISRHTKAQQTCSKSLQLFRHLSSNKGILIISLPNELLSAP